MDGHVLRDGFMSILCHMAENLAWKMTRNIKYYSSLTKAHTLAAAAHTLTAAAHTLTAAAHTLTAAAHTPAATAHTPGAAAHTPAAAAHTPTAHTLAAAAHTPAAHTLLLQPTLLNTTSALLSTYPQTYSPSQFSCINMLTHTNNSLPPILISNELQT